MAAKTGGEVYQWNILKNSAIPEEELVNFRDPVHWLNYFPPLGKRDITSMGYTPPSHTHLNIDMLPTVEYRKGILIAL